MSEGMLGGKKGDVISFKNTEELEKKRSVKKGLECVAKALVLAYEGGGEVSVPSAEKKSDIMDLLGRLKTFERGMLKNPLTSDTLDDVASLTTEIKIGLSEYLSGANSRKSSERTISPEFYFLAAMISSCTLRGTTA